MKKDSAASSDPPAARLVVRERGEERTIELQGSSIAIGRSRENQIEIRIQGKRLKGLADFNAKIEALHKSNPEAKATLYPNSAALYIDCVKVVNECLRANFTAITFGGTRMDS